MKPAIALKATLQCICDHLPETGYEEYVHQQASEFSLESRILCQPVTQSGITATQAVVELLLSDGTLTLTGFGDSAYTALKDALNVFAPRKSPLSLAVAADTIPFTCPFANVSGQDRLITLY